MKKQRFLILISAIFIFIILLTCCEKSDLTEQEPTSAVTTIEYKKITPQEAEAMMSDDVIVLDVRTQEEFDDGHIKNAVLLPDYEIKEKAANILPDKNKIILIYCRTGRRSANAAKELIDMGYTDIYDFGGIVDWTGEIEK